MEKTLIDLHLQKDIHTITGNLTLDVKFSIPEFGFITLFRKSGGENYVLRMIADYQNLAQSYNKVDNEFWFDYKSKQNLKTQREGISDLYFKLYFVPKYDS